ncbi:hypothetical protein N1030_07150 [Desulfovibrio mangrovi]|uniref:hypothetical protein n=1 Tax=Desulfovibrio mangrovi TaxID=2976983 RepID=UPI0022470655|nr:hypothetical protein [Desulfovibrio mangrovi]UZP68740.1 hypothetical protein N1030_07150 [Desulfovibrio mangrovi]
MDNRVCRFFDPVYELACRGVRVQLAEASAGPDVVVQHEKRYRETREELAHQRWVQMVLTRYSRLIRLQLQLGGGLLPYRSVAWLVAHGYVEVREGRFRVGRQ